MKEFFKSLYTNKKRLAISVIVILIVGYFIYRHYSTPATQTSYVTSKASNQTIVVSVTGTGQVSQNHTVNIQPQGSGALTAVDVTQGQQVKSGQTIGIVDESNNTISLNEAKAGLASAQANLASVMAGDTTQDIQLGELTVQSDQEAVANASSSLDTTKQQDNTNVANALSNLLNSNPEAIASAANVGTGDITISGNYTASAQGTYTITVFSTNAGQQFQVSGLESGTGPVRSSPPVALGVGGLYVSFSGKPGNGDAWTITVPNTLAPNYISNYNAYQSALANQATDITNAENAITSAENKLQQDQINLQVKQLPPTDQQVQSAQASVTNAEAQLQNAEIAYNNNILKAPFDGEIAELNNQVGDQVSASTIVAVITNNESQAIIPLNEVDVANVKVGDKATMTFDAVSGLTISGTVVEIDNIGTVSQGVVNYNVKVAFDTEDPRVKAGMSVDVAIITNIQADTLSVPSAAIKTQGSNNFVQVLDTTQTQTVAGVTGVISKTAPKSVMVQVGVSDGTNTQILSGLTAGQTVVTQTVSSAKTTTTAAATSAVTIPGLGGSSFGGGGAGFRTGGGGGATRGGG